MDCTEKKTNKCSPQQEAYEQQKRHLNHAHIQALLAAIQGQQNLTLTVEDALKYFQMVKSKIGHLPFHYAEFMDIMKQCKSPQVNPLLIIARISQLFECYPELIKGFGIFLPPTYNILFQTNRNFFTEEQIQQKQEHSNFAQKPVKAKNECDLPIDTKSNILNWTSWQIPDVINVSQAVSFLLKVKQKFQNRSETYSHFLSIIYKHVKECRKIPELLAVEKQWFASFSKLLEDEELIDEFSDFKQKFLLLILCVHMFRSSDQQEIKDLDLQKYDDFELMQNLATALLQHIKKWTEDKPTVYTESLNIMHTFYVNCIEILSAKRQKLCDELCKVFVNDRDLYNDFQKLADCEVLALLYLVPSVKKNGGVNFRKRKCESSLNGSKARKIAELSDPSFAEVGKFGTYKEHLFFDKVKTALKHPEVFDNFLRCLSLYNDDIISSIDLLNVATSFLGTFPELLREFKDILGLSDMGINVEPVSHRVFSHNSIDADLAMDIDYSTGRRNGTSYRALPKMYEQPKCSGRTPLCKEVINDTWVSFPSWSEDSTFVSSCKTFHEEMMYRCEDERFEMDILLENIASTIQVFDNTQKRINKMTQEEKATFALDDTLGGTSSVLYKKTLKLIYGDKTCEVIEGLKRNTLVAVPIVLKRLKIKQEEWKGAQAKFNEIWRDQTNAYYLKSLDHQGLTFKQSDGKYLRFRSLLNEIEALYEEKKEQIEEGSAGGFRSPHLILHFKDLRVFDDALNLIFEHIKKQSAVYREEKQKIEQILRHFLADFFCVPRGTISDDDSEQSEDELEESMQEDDDDDETSGENSPNENGLTVTEDGDSDADESNIPDSEELACSQRKKVLSSKENSQSIDKISSTQPLQTDLSYNIFFVNNNWYVFFRQFYVLCDRLSTLLHESIKNGNLKSEKDKPDSIDGPGAAYMRLLSAVSELLRNDKESLSFDDEMRNLFGISAYLSFTMDKVIQCIGKQLHQIVNEEACKQCTSCYVHHVKKVTADGCTCFWELTNLENVYQKKVEQVIGDENCYKMMWYKKEHFLTIELLDPEPEPYEEPCEVEKWSDYWDTYLHDDSISDLIKASGENLPVILMRNLRKQKKIWAEKLRLKLDLLKKENIKPCSRTKLSLLTKHKEEEMNLALSIDLNDDSKEEECDVKKHSDISAEQCEQSSCSYDMEKEEVNIDSNIDRNDDIEIKTSYSDEMADVNIDICDSDNESFPTQLIGTIHGEVILYDIKSEYELTPDISDKTVSECKLNENDVSSDLNAYNSEDFTDITLKSTLNDDVKSVEGKLPVLDEKCDEVLQSCAEEKIVDEAVQISTEDKESEQLIIEENIADEVSEMLRSLESTCDSLDVNICSSSVAEDVPAMPVDVQTDCHKFPEIEKQEEIPISEICLFQAEKYKEWNLKSTSELSDKMTDCLKRTQIESKSDANDNTVKESGISIEPDDNVKKFKEISLSNEGNSCGKSNANNSSTLSHTEVSSSSSKENKVYDNENNSSHSERMVSPVCVENDVEMDAEELSDSSSESEVSVVDDNSADLENSPQCRQYALDSMAVVENTQCKFDGGAYKFMFVKDHGCFMHRKNSLTNARKNHKHISAVLSEKFNIWHRIWLERYVTPNMLKSCLDWLLRSDPDKFRIDCITMNDFSRPPYGPYTKYRIKHYKI